MTIGTDRAIKWRASLFFVCLAVFMASSYVKAQVNGDLRLTGYGASKLAGRIEMFRDGEWGTVCADERDNFDFIAASVACRQLGLGYPTDWYGVFAPSKSRFGVGGGRVELEEVVCEGGEAHLLRCRYSRVGGGSTCQHQYDIAVACSNISTPYSGEVRLMGGNTPSVGMVELYTHRQWLPLCWTGFGWGQANAVCRQLGYTEAASFREVSADGPFWQVDTPYMCAASTPCFTNCTELPVTTTTSCPGNTAVKVQCVYSPEVATNLTSGNATLCHRDSVPLDEGAVRLSNVEVTSDTRSGVVEVHFNGSWGTLCDESFRYQEADVVCKELGFPAALTFYHNGHLGEGTGSIYTVSCSGLELSLNDCIYSSIPYFHTRCNHSDDVGVKCSSTTAPYGSLTLRGGAGAMGTLLIYTKDLKLEPFCDTRFGMNEAAVACRQLGYQGAVAVRKNSYFTTYTSDDSTIMSYSPSCSGSESHLLECSLARGMVSCRRGMDEVGIQCSTSHSPSLRLVSGDSPRSGRLEVNLGGGEWGTVCGGEERFSHFSAYVVCRQLNHSTAVGLHLNRYGSGVGPIQLSSASCVGFEGSLFDCPLTLGDGEGVCSHDMDVGIECGDSPLNPDGELRLVNRTSENGSSISASGRLEMFLYGVWVTVCGKLFSQQAADVACRQLGFGYALEYCTNACFGSGSGYIFFAEDHCTGAESSLLECSSDIHNPTQCNHSTDVGIVCEGTISPPPPIASTPAYAAQSSGPHVPTFTSAHSSPSPPANPPPSIEPPSPLIPFPELYFYVGLGVVGLIAVSLIVAVTCCCICRIRKKHSQTCAAQSTPVRASGNDDALYSHDGYDDPTITLEMKTLSKSAEAAACASPPLEPPPNYDELEFISPTQSGDATANGKL